MEELMTASFYILTLIEYFSFYYILLGKKPYIKGRKRNWWIPGVVFVIFLASCQKWNTGIYLIPSYFVSFLVMYLIFDISLWENIRMWLMSVVILSVVESLINYLLLLFSSFSEIHRILIYVMCIDIFMWLYYLLLGKRIGRDAFKLPVRVWCIVVGIMLLIAGMITYFTFVLTMIPQRKLMAGVGIGLVVAGGSAMCILVFALIYYFNGTQKYQLENDLLEKYNEQQKSYFLQMLQREQSTRQFRHDIIYDLMELNGYCNNKDYVNLKQYLQDMLGNITEINVRQYDVGNDIINTIINYYFQPIRAKCDIVVNGYMGNETVISQRDICTVVANLVKNAVEAVEAPDEKQREIRFDVSQGEKYLRICVENTIGKDVVIGRDGLPETTKADKYNHGLGLKNVVNVVKKYDGLYNMKTENRYYIAEVYLKT